MLSVELGLDWLRLDPVAFSIGPIQVRWYSLAYITGILSGWLLSQRVVKNKKLWSTNQSLMTSQNVDDVIIWIAIGILVGARLGHVIFYAHEHFLESPWMIIQVWHGGMSFHGGLCGVLLAITVFCKLNRVPLLSSIDVAAIVAPIGIFLGRIANFINGELLGRVTTSPFGVIFPWVDYQLRHPTQLYEAFFEGFLLFCIMLFLSHHFRSLRYPGLTSSVFAIWYGTARILIEFFREPDTTSIEPIPDWITMGQLLSIPMIVFGAFLLSKSTRKHNVGN